MADLTAIPIRAGETGSNTARHSRDWLRDDWEGTRFNNEAHTLSQLEYALAGLATLTKMLDIDDCESSSARDGEEGAAPLDAHVAEGLRHAAVALAEFSHEAIQGLREGARRG